MASGLSFLCGVPLNQHLNPRPCAAVPNQPGSLRLCQALRAPHPHAGLLPHLFTCCFPFSPGPLVSLRARWGEAGRCQLGEGAAPVGRAGSGSSPARL